MTQKIKYFLYAGIALFTLSILANIIGAFRGNTAQVQGGGGLFNIIFLIVGLAAGLGVAFYLFKKNKDSSGALVTQNSTVMLQKIERVFKVVTAEGHFSEVFDYSHTSNLHDFLPIPSTKKALLIVNAKVLMGFDFKKLKCEIDEVTRKVNILEFPQPEVLSMESDIKYYNMENGLFNKFDNIDLTKLQLEAKDKISSKVATSELPHIAQKQMQQLLQMGEVNSWHLLGEQKILSLPVPKAY
jgi:hypothetical protein